MTRDDERDGNSDLPTQLAIGAARVSPAAMTDLAAPVGITGAQTLPAAAATPLHDLTGLIFGGRYLLERRLGRGGMGEVWRAKHTGLGVAVAFKVMLAGLAAATEHVRRFSREAHALGLLSHENVVRVMDVGMDHGRYFMVMEFLQGEPLDSYIERHRAPPPVADAVDIVAQIAAGLEAAHRAGVVHRDLKPGNVILCDTADGKRIVKLVDFGLAHVDDARDEATLTNVASVAGTPPYMSPEQCRSLAVGPSTDIYALGCVLTELLQLEPPFSGNTPIDIVAKQMFSPPPPLARPAESEPVPELLERLRLDLLQKTPQRRPPSGMAILDRLDEVFDEKRARSVLPPRSMAVEEARTARLPSWQAAAPSVLSDLASEGTVGILRLVADSVLGDDAVSALRVNGCAVVNLGPDDALTELQAVILDVGDNAELAMSWLAQAAERPPVLVCLYNPNTDALTRLIGQGASEVLRSPPEVNQLVRRVRRVLKRKR